MLVSGGDAAVLVERPVSLGLLAATGALLPVIAAPGIRRTRSSVPVEQ